MNLMLFYGGYMAVKSVFGFFYRIGSVDYPINYDPNIPFGFDTNSPGTPIFKYSVNNVENALVACRTLVRRSFYDHNVNGDLEVGANKSSDIIIADSTGGYSDIVTEDISTSDWDAAFKIAEFLYNNQSKVFTNPSKNEFFSWGDEMLASSTKPNSLEENMFYNNKYIKNSLSYSLSSVGNGMQGRLESVSFSVFFTNLGSNVLFRLYFDADAFVERTDNIKYKVFRYEDLEEPSNIVSPDEMREQIIKKQFALLHEGKYNECREYFVDKRISDSDDFVREQFFVYSTLKKAIEDTIARLAIKEYLLDYYNNDMVYLRYTYPSLFDENEIHLIPLYDNFSGIIDANSEMSSELNLLYSLSISRLANELLAFGYNIAPSHYDYKPIEVFHIGPGNEWVPGNGSSFRYLFPIIAVELDSESGINLPISARFPNFRPIYGSEEGGKASEFHSILVYLFEYLLGISPSLDAVFKNTYNVVVYEAGSSAGTNNAGQSVSGNAADSPTGINRKRVGFTFNGDLWLLYGPLQGSQ
jgi:hypothetical protein